MCECGGEVMKRVCVCVCVCVCDSRNGVSECIL